jgi:hypothetical protein
MAHPSTYSCIGSLILSLTLPGELVVDAFCGSGSKGTFWYSLVFRRQCAERSAMSWRQRYGVPPPRLSRLVGGNSQA